MATQESRYNWLQSITDLAQYINQGNQKKLQETEGLLRIGEMKKKLYEEEASKRMATSFIGNIQKAATAEELNKLNVDILKQSTEAGLLNVYNMVQPAVQTRHYEFADTEKKDLAKSTVTTIMESYKDNLFHHEGNIVKGEDLFKTLVGDVNKNPIAAMQKLDVIIKNNSVLTKNTTQFRSGKNYFNQSLVDSAGKVYETTDPRQGGEISFTEGQYIVDLNDNEKVDKGEVVPSEISEEISRAERQEDMQNRSQNKVRGMTTIQLTNYKKGDSKFKQFENEIQEVNGNYFIRITYDQQGNMFSNGIKVPTNLGIPVGDIIKTQGIDAYEEKKTMKTKEELVQSIRTYSGDLFKITQLEKGKFPKLHSMLLTLAQSKSNKDYSDDLIKQIYSELSSEENIDLVQNNLLLNDTFISVKKYLKSKKQSKDGKAELRDRIGLPQMKQDE